jgi:hypothetical protein
MINSPIYKKKLPQVWIEDDNFIIESPTFRYVIKTDTTSTKKKLQPLNILFALCRKMNANSIESTYVYPN